VLGQGVTEPERELGTAGAHAALADKASQLRQYCGALAERRVGLARRERSCRVVDSAVAPPFLSLAECRRDRRGANGLPVSRGGNDSLNMQEGSRQTTVGQAKEE
jgi:hypothetical protein